MGRKFNEIGNDASRVPYELKADNDGDVVVNINGKNYSPPEISAMVLRKMKETAERIWVKMLRKQLSLCLLTSMILNVRRRGCR